MSAGFIPTPEMVDAVSEWHQRQGAEQIRRPLVPTLRARFELDNAQAIAVIRAADLRRARAV
ncbi:MAG: hypothetical protein E5Y59_16310 [Mesorhizobium sp.]|uniref:hypothetical protein n=1 Tax=Mesorhizobium sp. TaxID=1871066 RepID=UPI001224CD5C|nr:hypothetical protein [Mesorhizobium sp.]TIL70375.1 MAG: hypothetical protein E5Y70_31305 [Mesorhizobium sp.]TIN08388.1 MAG: hypothetical protein E5Y59_16310 [Mesorhizobium sp.]